MIIKVSQNELNEDGNVDEKTTSFSSMIGICSRMIVNRYWLSIHRKQMM